MEIEAMTLGGNAQQQLKSIVERIERLEDDKAGIASDIRDVFKEASHNGLDTKVLREVIRLRKLDAEDRNARMSVLDTYMHALGMTPLEQAIAATPTQEITDRPFAPPPDDDLELPVELKRTKSA
jgi:uncharacterized protein (UPF0335 family)